MTILQVKVTPRAREDRIVSFEEGVLKVRLNALPEKGEANKALVKLLSKELDIPQHRIVLVSGGSSKLKRFEIEGVSQDEILQRLHLI